MGAYVNPGNRSLTIALNDEIYVDKSMILTVLNKKFDTEGRFMCVSRPRRFGKTMVGNMISAFYSRGCDSRPIFEKLQISRDEGWDERLNRCNVIQIDLGSAYARYRRSGDVIMHLACDVVDDMRREFPDMDIREGWPLPKAIAKVFEATGVPFVVIIDEYDVMVRERVPQSDFNDYLDLLNDLFKSPDCGGAIGLAYITGIIPIVRDRVQSKLNNFKEYTMLSPRDLAPYIGFTLPEVKALCERHVMDYDECLRWYDGYKLTPEVSICNSNSVCEAIATKRFGDYWTQTGAYTAISDYIDGDYDGIREDIATMVGGGSVEIDAGMFMNTLDSISTKDDVFTYLIHLGYLVYDQQTSSCRIPNGEIRLEWERALRRTVNYKPLVEMIRSSRALLEATIERDAEAVAEALDKAHLYVATPFTYDNEGSLQSAIGLAYVFARTQYTLHTEFHSGKGYADMALIPYVPNRPYIVIELKMDEKPERGLRQIIENGYADDFRDAKGQVYLVAVSYNKATKRHTCRIEVEER